jgi:hypothetical protein
MKHTTTREFGDAILARGANTPGPDDLMNFEDAAIALGCSIRALRYKQAANKMPPRYRRGRRLYYRRRDIVALANQEA